MGLANGEYKLTRKRRTSNAEHRTLNAEGRARGASFDRPKCDWFEAEERMDSGVKWVRFVWGRVGFYAQSPLFAGKLMKSKMGSFGNFLFGCRELVGISWIRSESAKSERLVFHELHELTRIGQGLLGSLA